MLDDAALGPGIWPSRAVPAAYSRRYLTWEDLARGPTPRGPLYRNDGRFPWLPDSYRGSARFWNTLAGLGVEGAEGIAKLAPRDILGSYNFGRITAAEIGRLWIFLTGGEVPPAAAGGLPYADAVTIEVVNDPGAGPQGAPFLRVGLPTGESFALGLDAADIIGSVARAARK